MSLWTPLSLCPISFRVLSFLFIITCFPIFPRIYPLTHFHILVNFPVRFVIDFSLSPTVVREETLHTLQICWKLNCGLTWNALPPRPLENKEDSVVAGSSALCVLDLVVLTVSGLFSFQVLSLLVQPLSSCPTHYREPEIEISTITGTVYVSLQFHPCLLPRFPWAVIGCVNIYNYYISCCTEPFRNMWYSSLSHDFFLIKAYFVWYQHSLFCSGRELLFTWNILFHPFVSKSFVASELKWVSCRQHILGWGVFAGL